jgi:cytochrome c peroxidase
VTHHWKTVLTLAAFAASLCVSIEAASGAGDPAQPRRDDDRESSAMRWTDEEFGRHLFFDRRLSADGSTGCSSCHDPGHGFSDSHPVSTGVHGAVGQRHAPSLLDIGDRPLLFWDGRADTLEIQVLGPLTNSHEQGLSVEDLTRILNSDAAYAVALGARAAPTHEDSYTTVRLVVSALAAYERTLRSPPSVVDRLVLGDAAGVPDAVRRGFAVFRGDGNCVACHRIEGPRPSLTDDAFHPAASDLSNAVLHALPGNARRLADLRVQHRDIGELVVSDAEVAALGRFAVTLVPADVGLFRTPSLRVVASTAPYMHDGSVPDLRAAVLLEAYRRGDGLRRPIPLTAQQIDDLVEFLSTLKAPTTLIHEPDRP